MLRHALTACVWLLRAHVTGLVGTLAVLKELQGGIPVSESLIAYLEDSKKEFIERLDEAEKGRRTIQRELRAWCGPSRKKSGLAKEFLRSLKTTGVH